MKYGETLSQRSVPQWAYQNVDYDAIKWLIKEQTSSGKAKAISVPGQGNETELLFESDLYHHLVEQHDKVGLFVKSKSGEIQRRLDHLDHHLHNLQIASWPPSRLQNTIPPSRLAKYSRIEQQTIETGEEIKHLSRFIAAQRLAFIKLLKKYKKWTGRSSLSEKFNEHVLSQPGSFTRFDLKPHLEHWSDLLQGIRVAMGVGRGKSSVVSSPSIQPMVSLESSASVARKLQEVLRSGVEVDFDLIFSYAPLGSEGSKAVYWVHPEQLVELQVLLLQHTRLAFPKTSPRPSTASQHRSRQNSLARRESYVDKALDHGVVVIDNAEELAEKANGIPISESEDSDLSFRILPAASISWTAAEEAAIWVKDKNLLVQSGGLTDVPRVRKKKVGAFLDVDKPFPQRQGTETPDSSSGTPLAGMEAIEPARRWFKSHSYAKPLVGYFSKRSRFAALSSRPDHGLWCTLDSEVLLKSVTKSDFEGKEWPQKIMADATTFPYAVLEVRQEGIQDLDLIKILDESHLTERIRGFSLAAHALWTCRRPRCMTPPFWLPVLSVDIRKLPSSGQAKRNRQLSRSTAAGPGDGYSGSASSIVSAGEDTSGATTLVGSVDFQVQDHPARRTRKPKKQWNSDTADTGVRYWSEYDHPEEAEEEEGGYYIYVNPEEQEESWMPFQGGIKKIYVGVKNLFNKNKAFESGERDPLLSPIPGIVPKPSFSEEDGSTSSDEEDETHAAIRSQYGTFLRHEFHPNGENSEDVITLVLFSSISLFFSAMISIVLLVLSAVGRHKAKEEIDIVISIGVFVSLAFALAGFWGLARQGSGWTRWVIAGIIFAGVVLIDGILMGRLVRELKGPVP